MADIGEDLRLLKAKLAPKAAERRREADRQHVLKDDDGRRRRGAKACRHQGEQINFKVPAGTKARMERIADKLDVPLVQVFLRGLEAMERK